MADLTALVNILKAAGEDTRLRLLALLAEGDHTVKDLTEILRQSQPRVSRHLKLLADAGLVQRNAEGAWAYYSLAQHGEGAALGRWLVERLDDGPERKLDRVRQNAVRAAQQEQAAAFFAKVAGHWDELRRLHVPESAVEEAVADALAGQDVDLLIDLGTGTGRMLEVLADNYKRGIGIDSSREMLGVARAKLTTGAIGNAQVRLGDMTAMDASVGPADVLVLHQVLHYFDDPGRILAQSTPLLKDDGQMLIVDFAPHEHEFLRVEQAHRRLGLSTEQLDDWAKAVGFSVDLVREFPSESGEQGLTVCLWRLTRPAQSFNIGN
ncbi:metalloregulator ArsR/SmtB family transcription factor [Devosia rhodophyticola]|uniref:Metalloregulator ArsR/SmtB family transcription factor n=1 Tax=Devosia rhodophyticola TaxID=3026423 RepID=A0ABY7YVD1_9HYPH|nr:metalloregulator ArsR/SmtB family transcription factor [Devosia rhodophyticola]WDR05318.1 metalloregulator ArsR/SmtB family transcription factor [Devosia rhodophyticola]